MIRTFAAILVTLASSHAIAQDPCQVDRLVAPDTFEPNSFGIGVASDGDHWFVADHQAEVFCSGFGCGVGAVYVYEMVGGELAHTQSLVSPLAQSPDNFGRAVDADGGILVVGAPFSGIAGRLDRPGAVFVYELVGGVWGLSSIIEPPLGAGRFGFNVAIHGGTVAVADFDNERVLVYEREDDAWILVSELYPPSEVSPDSSFGVALDLDSRRIVVGASRDRSRVGAGGSIHIYRKLLAGGFEIEQSEYSSEQQLFGAAVAIGGDDLFVGANAAARQFEEQGVVHHYSLDGSGWNKIDELASEQAEFRRGFGATLELDGDSLAITANRERAVYVFQRETIEGWRQSFRLRPDTLAFADGFGFSFALRGSKLLVGADDESDTFGSPVYGAAYLIDLACTVCPPDLDADGALTIFDFLTFLNLFQDGDAQADFDGDGELTIFDFLAFQTAFDAGCE